ncbi:MAG: AAA family ATPase [Gammaproteobacteria bacterium]|nr:AAA family ATPase [Gammaproteobacteria bacterium]
MRIDRIRISNFKKFEEKELDLNPRFTLLVGDNGAGKTTLLDALAVAAGIWLVKPPDSTLVGSGRNILKSEIRLKSSEEGDRTQLVECKPVSVRAEGEILGEQLSWLREIRATGVRTSNAGAKAALNTISRHFSMVDEGHKIVSPIVAYYGAGRAWLPSRRRRPSNRASRGPARRWEAFYDCFEERIRLGDIQRWFRRETIAYANRRIWRPGFNTVKHAIKQCVPGADDLWYDGDRGEIVMSIDGHANALANLSAGQRMMVALIADIAIKVVTQNAHLLVQDRVIGSDDEEPEVLNKTPGLVLLDEIDAHLHPKWQRRVVDDLKRMFPLIQFVCTSHSPFIIQSLEHDELRTLDETGPPLVEYSNRSIEDIAEDIQQVKSPQQSEKAKKLNDATERYFYLLKGKGTDVKQGELERAEKEYREASERYGGSPGLDAILKLEAMVQEERVQKKGSSR